MHTWQQTHKGMDALEAIHSRGKCWPTQHLRGGYARTSTKAWSHRRHAMMLRAVHHSRTAIQRYQSILLPTSIERLLEIAWLLVMHRRLLLLLLLLPASLQQTSRACLPMLWNNDSSIAEASRAVAVSSKLQCTSKHKSGAAFLNTRLEQRFLFGR